MKEERHMKLANHFVQINLNFNAATIAFDHVIVTSKNAK